MSRGRIAWRAAIAVGVIVWCFTLLACSSVSPGLGAAGAARHGPAHRSRTPGTTRELAESDSLAACERQLESTARGIPTMAIAGASYTAGVGPRNPELSWAVQLAKAMRWNAVVYGVSGAGYVRAGAGGKGPVARLIAAEGLAALDPALVIVQAGHDDAGVPPEIERARVRQAVALIRAEVPHALIALLTVFTRRSPSRPTALFRTDAAIIAGALAADPSAIIMDPLAGRWDYQHFHGGLHPTAAGDTWIAGKVAQILRAHGVLPADGKSPMICDAAAGVGQFHGGDGVTTTIGDRRSDA